ncbi:gp18 [Streptococcus pneumoniae]|uniref:Gp18 n=1 Tax=Streptococcus pneumoniae TaxID=1313 RepID=A0A4J1RG92_STREE|nr:hypothetical protein [Streptococcus pneumoniae]CZD36755.1 gp18 [Streptococcus pneumoniae]VJN19952.1 gp18 [Streptococcus pneumoniae]VLN78179.1 gp18 [Streptococcus pneumoniae]VLU76356.1 gp18 [Streptococcus pneumoniae]VLW70721.1 gp18 [Streptococcus pneumoniae]
MEELIESLDNLIMIVKELEGRESTPRHFITIWENDYKNLLLVKEYLTDYEKLAKDYRDVELKNKLLKIEKMELEGRYIYEDMRMKYRANRRKWGGRLRR